MLNRYMQRYNSLNILPHIFHFQEIMAIKHGDFLFNLKKSILKIIQILVFARLAFLTDTAS